MTETASLFGSSSPNWQVATWKPLCAVELSAETYDGNGSVTGSGGNTYAYNSLGRLTSATVNGVATTYVYDGDGILVSKTTNGVTTKFLTDGGVLNGYPQVLAEVVNGSVVRSYSYGLNRISMTDVTAGKTYYFGTDGAGSTRALMDEAGVVTDTFDWAADGILLNHTGTTVCPFGFQGEYTDGDTGLVYLRARWMNPQTGRFMGMDTYEGAKKDPLGLNKYEFVKGDGGVNRMDPSGQSSIAEVSTASAVQGVLSNEALVHFLGAVSALGLALHNLPTRFFHYTTGEKLELILESGFIGLQDGPVSYYTSSDYSYDWEAQQKLALPNKPNVKIKLTLYPTTDLLIGPLPVLPDYAQQGGGIEYFTPLRIPIASRQPIITYLW